jgi:glycosyltransferase involved in cell wall biosynthesis
MIADAIDSVSRQSFPSSQYEVIVVDNGSTDDTKDIVCQFNRETAPPVRYMVERRRGLHWARHAGAKAARGDILVYTDDDAIASENWLRELARAYRDFDADCAGGKILIRWDRDPPRWIVPFEPYLGRIDHGPGMRLLEPGQFINGGNFSIKRQRLYEIGGFNPDQIGDRLIGDGEIGLCRRIHSAGWRMVWVPDALIWHCQTVSRNATLADLKRRFANNGVGQAYEYYRQTRCRRRHLLHRSASELLRSIGLKTRAIRRMPARDRTYYECELRAAFEWGQAAYFGRLFISSKLRRIAFRENWIELTSDGTTILE